MKKFHSLFTTIKFPFFVVAILTMSYVVKAQEQTNVLELNKIAEQANKQWNDRKLKVETFIQQKNIERRRELPNGKIIEIIDVVNNVPRYYTTFNVNAAYSTNTNELWAGGSLGLSLNGTGFTNVAIWDGGKVRNTHQEFNNTGVARVTQSDGASSLSNHATHVAGTIMAGGVSSGAKGMANNAQLKSYDWSYDESEMANAAANGLLISNHSYGTITGWHNGVWYGDPSISTQEDYLFGFYSSGTAQWDNIAYNAPYYLIVKSAGNDRNESGNGSYPPDGNNGYDCIPHIGIAKNVLTVGAVYDVPNYTSPSSVQMTSFSSWGPADDGRIKPDIVGNGYSLYSPLAGSDANYGNYSGTSMSSPNVSGTLVLLQQHYQNTHNGQSMRAATLKALVINTANEAGTNIGPDYQFGWGLLNAEKAAETITKDEVNDFVMDERTLTNGETQYIDFYSDGSEPIKVTVVWTDPAHSGLPASLDPSTLHLINDLDVLVTGNNQNFYPYKLDKNNPSAAATNFGENNVDNVEHIEITNPNPGLYTIRIDHDGTLQGNQAYSIIISGASVCSDSDNDGVCDADDVCPNLDDNLIGMACDDGDACTVNDVYGTDCNCTGTYSDSDNDGVCDAFDICPGFDDALDADGDGIPDGCDSCNQNLVGTSCDDGDACTTNDVYDANCNCVGTYQDADNDGVCDADDVCPNLDDNLIGMACDDGNACTVNDIYGTDCNCTGTYSDSDNDGVCDAFDICPGFDDALDADGDGIPDGCDSCNQNLVGTSCDDGDTCTINDVYDADCNCMGTYQDADNDGVCDADDVCTSLDDNLIGTSCDDGDACTVNDVYGTDCNCTGTYSDSDNDGVCDAFDICPGFDDTLDADGDGIPDGCDSCNQNLTGTSCDDGDACTINDVYDADCNCMGTYQDADNDGVCDTDDVCPSLDDNLIGMACDDGDACTVNDVYGTDCNCAGTFAPMGIVEVQIQNGADDVEERQGDGYMLIDSDDVELCYDSYKKQKNQTVGLRWTNVEVPNGVVITNAYIQFTADETGKVSADLTIKADDTDNSLSFNPQNFNVSSRQLTAASVQWNPVMWDAVGESSVNQQTPNLASVVQEIVNKPGWQSGNAISFIITGTGKRTAESFEGSSENAAILHVEFETECCTDSDDDGICDSSDQCPGIDDGIIGTSCDDGDECTYNDVYTASCNCMGTPSVDNDNDGYCSTIDPDDYDACVPDVNADACDPCASIIEDDFELGMGNWNDGGSDCALSTQYSNSGSYSVKLRDNSGIASSMISNTLNLSNYNEIYFKFSYYAFSMEINEDFVLEVSTDNGATFSTVEQWISGVNFINKLSYDIVVHINTVNFTNSTVFRLRCDASAKNDAVYIDDVVISPCPIEVGPAISKGNKKLNVAQNGSADLSNPLFKVYPNPVSETLFIEIENGNNEYVIQIFNLNGVLVKNLQINSSEIDTYRIDIEDLVDGIYLLKINDVKGNFVDAQRLIVNK